MLQELTGRFQHILDPIRQRDIEKCVQRCGDFGSCTEAQALQVSSSQAGIRNQGPDFYRAACNADAV